MCCDELTFKQKYFQLSFELFVRVSLSTVSETFVSVLGRLISAVVEIPISVDSCITAYFSVYYYTKCALLKAGCETLTIHVCNIKVQDPESVSGYGLPIRSFDPDYFQI